MTLEAFLSRFKMSVPIPFPVLFFFLKIIAFQNACILLIYLVYHLSCFKIQNVSSIILFYTSVSPWPTTVHGM
jgi:hypothetical protein